MAGIAMSHSSCLPLPSWPSSVLGPTPRPKKRDRGLNRSIVLDPLVNPGNQAHRHEACAAAHLARTLTRLVVMAQGSSSQRAQGPSQEEIATVVLGRFQRFRAGIVLSDNRNFAARSLIHGSIEAV